MRQARLALAAGLLLAACGGAAGPRGGDELYAKYCTRCHGADGKGDPRTVNLYPQQDLPTSPMVRGRDRVLIHDRIAHGYGPMPGFAHRLEPAELGHLVDRTLEFGTTPGGR